MVNNRWDYIIVGSGFGGSVSALRLTEKGYRVLVIEKGKRFGTNDFSKTNWNIRKWLWIPALRFFGIMRISFFRHVSILSGTGVGGGSLVYANTLPLPRESFFHSGSWKNMTDWRKELEPFYQSGWKMLGAAQNPKLGVGDKILREMADEMGRSDWFEPTKVAVNFGEPNVKQRDPYFKGDGPEVTGCNFCGGCMTGCRFGAKNSLDRNYLWLAERRGATILAETEVRDIVPDGKNDGSEGYVVKTKGVTGFLNHPVKSFRTKGIILAGGVLGTVQLMLKLKRKSLPALSDMVGRDIRTNNESLSGIISLDKNLDYSEGIAIGSILHTDENSHLEPVRYGSGSGFWRILMLPFTLGPSLFSRVGKIFGEWFSSPLLYLRTLFVRNWATRAQILLFMQHLDSTLKFVLKGNRMKTKKEKGAAPTPFIPEAKKLADRFGVLANGKPHVLATEPLLGIPSTAHILGGAVMGSSPAEGVIDSSNRVYGYNNMLICDGSMISANPGVNPAITIVAISERAMSQIPEKIK